MAAKKILRPATRKPCVGTEKEQQPYVDETYNKREITEKDKVVGNPPKINTTKKYVGMEKSKGPK